MKNLLSFNFWFNSRPEPLTKIYLIAALILVSLLVISAIIIKLTEKKQGSYKSIFNQLTFFSLFNAATGFIWIFCNYELIPVFAARFWAGLWLITVLGWLVIIYINSRKRAKRIAEKLHSHHNQKDYNKYLPKKK